MSYEDFEDEYEDFREVTLTLEDGTELLCAVMAQFVVEDNEYIALLPLEEDDEYSETEEILLYKVNYIDDENFDIDLIEDEEEFEIASEAYYELMESSHDCGCHSHGHCDCEDGCHCGHNHEHCDCEDGCHCGHHHELEDGYDYEDLDDEVELTFKLEDEELNLEDEEFKFEIEDDKSK